MMNSILSNIIIFTAGAVVGSAVTWKLVKDKYERMAQEEIESVREFYNSKQQDTEEDSSEEKPEKPHTPTAREVYAGVVDGLGYMNASDNKTEEEEEDEMVEPYVISPSEFGECGYETESLWYYAGDGVVTTYFGEVVEDVAGLIGEDFASHYGEYEEDSVHIRNDNQKTDFEVLRDLSAFSEK